MSEKMNSSKKHETVHAHGGHHVRHAHHAADPKVEPKAKATAPVSTSRLDNAMRSAALALNGTRLGQVVVLAFALTTAAVILAAADRESSPVFDDGGADVTETEATRMA